MTAANTNKSASAIKFFRCYESMKRYINYRYGKETADKIVDVPAGWCKNCWGEDRPYGSYYWFNTRRGTVGFKIEEADKNYTPREDNDNPLKPRHLPAAYDAENYAERQMEDMAAYIHSGAGLEAYYEDRDAGYAY